MPTVLNYLHYDEPYFAFGSDAFDPRTDNFLVNNIGGTYNFFMGDYFLTYDNNKPSSLHNLKQDPALKQDLLGKEPAVRDLFMRHLVAFIQQYNNRMIHNKLVAE